MLTQKNQPVQPAPPTPQSPLPDGQAPASASPDVPQMSSGTWVHSEDSQILIQWALNEVTTPSSFLPAASPSNPAYTARVSVYQLIFDTEFPSAFHPSPIVPFSVLSPHGGPMPYLQGRFILSQSPPTLGVTDFEFPGFQASKVVFFPDPAIPAPTPGPPATGSGSGGSTSPTTPAASGDNTGSGKEGVAGSSTGAA
jgi:hypothetical protein